MASVTISKVKKRFGATEILHGVDIDIADGSFSVLVGPSGCGKSTLLRMLAGLEEISDGEIRIGERRVNELPPKARDIAMVFQNYALYPHMTVRQNMAFALMLAKNDDATIESKVARAAGILGLTELLQRYPRQLSGGQRQRVAMGRAIVREPAVFLFDEPLSNLDAKLRAQTRLEIQKLHRELGITALFVTHDQVEAMTLAQRMIVMNAGRMEQIGTPEEVYLRPATTFVAGFIGSPPMNLMTGAAKAASFSCEGGSLRLPAPAPRDGELILGMRPEHASLGASGDEGWPLAVEMVEMLGAERLVHGRIGRVGFTLRIDATLPTPLVGDHLTLRTRPEHLHWFDAKTQARVSA